MTIDPKTVPAHFTTKNGHTISYPDEFATLPQQEVPAYQWRGDKNTPAEKSTFELNADKLAEAMKNRERTNKLMGF